MDYNELRTTKMATNHVGHDYNPKVRVVTAMVCVRYGLDSKSTSPITGCLGHAVGFLCSTGDEMNSLHLTGIEIVCGKA